jgi:hypothetical protein
MFSAALRKDLQSDFIAPTLSRRSGSISSTSSTTTSSARSSSERTEETELRPWKYHKRTAQDEVERKRAELRVRRAREAGDLWKEFWH